MIDLASLPNSLDSPSEFTAHSITRSQLYLVGGTLLVVWGLYAAWRRHAIKCLVPLRGPPPSSFLLGNTPDLYNAPRGFAYHHAISETYGRAFKIHMFAGEEQVWLSDTRALTHVLVRDTHVFDETPAMTSEFHYCFGPGLISVRGDIHKKQRKMIQPLFGAAHVRALTPTFWSIASQLATVIRARVNAGFASDAAKGIKKSENGQPAAVIDLWKWASRAALEGVGIGSLGYSFDALNDETEDNDFMIAVRELPYTVYPLRKFMPICIWCMRNLPLWLQHTLAKIVPVPRAQKVRRVVETIQGNCEKLYAEKKAALLAGDAETAAQIGAGKDVMSVLMKANMAATASEKESLTDEEVLGQMGTFISAGHDTMSSALARLLYCLAHDLPRQRQLREELAKARANTVDQLDFRAVTALPFLDAVYRETLRLYAPVPFQNRTATEAISIPLGAPVQLTNGDFVSELPIAKGQTVLVSIEAVNRDPEIWGPDADKWRPERWIEGLPESVDNAAVPGAFAHTLSFLGGSRSCIGMKYAEVELKTVLISLIENFEFSPAPGQENIVWRLSLMQNPALPGREHLEEPELPLLVTVVKPDAGVGKRAI
ncbi:cytochrome P450 [Favolaschia claudopus]|uniref:Cytochrome P450 n=1 Tax=Favolaschia claudopus TaxID=2862362 RepID=A0AAW0E8G4_9AGAR